MAGAAGRKGKSGVCDPSGVVYLAQVFPAARCCLADMPLLLLSVLKERGLKREGL